MKKNEYIPKVIHYCWFGKKKLGEKEVQCIESWKKIMPDYKIVRWDESNYNYNKNDFIKKAYKNKKWAFVSDYARLDIIYNYGGIYLDTDVEVLKKFDNLLDNECFFGFENENFVANGLGFGAKKNNKIIKQNLEEYNNLVFDETILNEISCPKITSKVLEKNGAILNNKFQKNELFTLYPKDYFCPVDYYTGKRNITDNTYSIHHYSMTWLSARDKRWYKIMNRLSRYLGKNFASIFVVVLKLPGSFIISLKNNGFKKTILGYLRKIILKFKGN